MGRTLALAADFPSAWKNIQPVPADKSGFVKISIPPETLDASREQLEDLRLYDDAGREIPFLIERPRQVQKANQPAKNFRVTLSGNTTIATMETGITRPVDGIFLQSPAREFLKAATLEGSNDGQNWQVITRGEPVFRQADGSGRHKLAFPPGIWAQLRVTLDDRRAAPIPLTGAQIFAADPEPAPAEPLDMKMLEREELPGQTRFTLQTAAANIPLAGIEIETTEPLFTRRVSLGHVALVDNEARETILASDLIYRIALDDQPVSSHLSFAADARIPGRSLALTIENADSPPLPVTAIRATRRPVYLAWHAAQTGTYHLLSGNPACNAPHYDLSQLPRDVAATLLHPVEQSPLTTNPMWRAGETLPDVTAAGIAIDLTNWKFRKGITLAAGGVQQLELDLEILSRASSSLADLRVVREGKQIPFLVEHPGFIRTHPLVIEEAADPKRPTVSRWRLHLPQKRLPAAGLAFECDAPLFKRSVTVLEEVPDERGDIRSLVRGQNEWTRVPGDKKAKLRVQLSSSLVTDALILEFDNGDNPPLELKDGQFTVPARRILFKAATGADTYLYFANPKAQMPHYDLQLVARQMLAAEKNKATPGTLEQLRTSWEDSEGFRGTGSWIFWLVLASVVGGLLFVIARLIPRPPA